jgi:hypothetical protein
MLLKPWGLIDDSWAETTRYEDIHGTVIEMDLIERAVRSHSVWGHCKGVKIRELPALVGTVGEGCINW